MALLYPVSGFSSVWCDFISQILPTIANFWQLFLSFQMVTVCPFPLP